MTDLRSGFFIVLAMKVRYITCTCYITKITQSTKNNVSNVLVWLEECSLPIVLLHVHVY